MEANTNQTKNSRGYIDIAFTVIGLLLLLAAPVLYRISPPKLNSSEYASTINLINSELTPVGYEKFKKRSNLNAPTTPSPASTVPISNSAEAPAQQLIISEQATADISKLELEQEKKIEAPDAKQKPKITPKSEQARP